MVSTLILFVFLTVLDGGSFIAFKMVFNEVLYFENQIQDGNERRENGDN